MNFGQSGPSRPLIVGLGSATFGQLGGGVAEPLSARGTNVAHNTGRRSTRAAHRMHLDLQSYGFTTEHQQVFDTTFRYAERELHPLLPRMDDEDWFPEEAFRKMSEVGLLGLTIPTEYGGAGMDLCSQFFAAEAVSYWNNPIAASWLSSDNLCAHNILRNADEAQRRRYLPRLCAGSAIGALGLTEPGAGSDALGAMRTTARRDGDCFRLNGRKMFITNGPVADLLLVYAKTSPERGAHGISAFIVEKSFEGFSVAQKLDKMGWRGSPTGELVFDECRVPVENLVFGENRGVAVVMSGLDIERVMLCAHGLGLSQRAFDLALGYAREREQFGARIADFQMVQAMLADMYTDLETMRALSYQLLREWRTWRSAAADADPPTCAVPAPACMRGARRCAFSIRRYRSTAAWDSCERARSTVSTAAARCSRSGAAPIRFASVSSPRS